MNYAWANPSTGIREQSSTPEEARLRVWEELQIWEHSTEPEPPTVWVFEQESAGWCSSVASDCILTLDDEHSYAWADPEDGMRYSAGTFAGAVHGIQTSWPANAPVDQVTVYRQRHAFSVRFDDPKPELPAPVEMPPDTPQSLIEQVLSGNCPDLGRAQLLAMLWIAEALQERRYVIPMRLRKRRRKSIQRRMGLWERFKLWAFGDPMMPKSFVVPAAPGAPLCEACGLPLDDPDGKICPNCAGYILKRMGADVPYAAPPPPRDWRVPIFNVCPNCGERIYPGRETAHVCHPSYRSGSAEKKEEGSPSLSEDAIARAIRERNRTPDPNAPHAFQEPAWDDQKTVKDPRCWFCRKPETDAIHGYTGI